MHAKWCAPIKSSQASKKKKRQENHLDNMTVSDEYEEKQRIKIIMSIQQDQSGSGNTAPACVLRLGIEETGDLVTHSQSLVVTIQCEKFNAS